MASTKCTKCGCGIHYHGEPCDIEYTFILESDWDRIISARFNASSKVYLNGSTSPLLFRSDTIEDDFSGAIFKFWKCPICGSLIFFNNEGQAIKTYVPMDQPASPVASYDIIGVIYDDYSWDALTEAAIPNTEIPQMYPPSKKIQLTKDLCFLTDSSHTSSCYQLL